MKVRCFLNTSLMDGIFADRGLFIAEHAFQRIQRGAAVVTF